MVYKGVAGERRARFKLIRVYSGKEIATGRQVAIKKIKVGQFKDGLDMSAVREVKYLRELHHDNVISVSTLSLIRFPLMFLNHYSSWTCSLRRLI